MKRKKTKKLLFCGKATVNRLIKNTVPENANCFTRTCARVSHRKKNVCPMGYSEIFSMLSTLTCTIFQKFAYFFIALRLNMQKSITNIAVNFWYKLSATKVSVDNPNSNSIYENFHPRSPRHFESRPQAGHEQSTKQLSSSFFLLLSTLKFMMFMNVMIVAMKI